jgi:6-phosphogluconolactonase
MTDNSKNRNVIVFEDAEKVAEYAAIKWMEIAEKAIGKTGCFTVALSGGKTPVTLYRKLAEFQKPLPWDKTHIFIVDERFVSFEHEESNFRMIYRALLGHVSIPEKNIHPVTTSTTSPAESAEKYEQELRSFFRTGQNEFPVLDLILLGMGEDGHTASLFPGTDALKETRHYAVPVSPPEKKERISLTLPLINNAKHIVFLVTGRNKAAVIRDVLERDIETLPASLVKPEKGRLFFFLDEEAGSLLFRITL